MQWVKVIYLIWNLYLLSHGSEKKSRRNIVDGDKLISYLKSLENDKLEAFHLYIYIYIYMCVCVCVCVCV